MAQIKYWNGEAAIIQVFFAPGVLSPEAVSEMLPRFETKVFRKSELAANAFVKQVVKHHDYYALLAVESTSLRQALDLAEGLENCQRRLSEKIKNSVYQATKAI